MSKNLDKDDSMSPKAEDNFKDIVAKELEERIVFRLTGANKIEEPDLGKEIENGSIIFANKDRIYIQAGKAILRAYQGDHIKKANGDKVMLSDIDKNEKINGQLSTDNPQERQEQVKAWAEYQGLRQEIERKKKLPLPSHTQAQKRGPRSL